MGQEQTPVQRPENGKRFQLSRVRNEEHNRDEEMRFEGLKSSPGHLGRVYIFEGSTGTFVECPVNITSLFGPNYGTCGMLRTSLGLGLQ